MLNKQGIRDNSFYFVFCGNKLLLSDKEGGLSIPTVSDIKDFDFDLDKGIYFGELDGCSCYCLDSSCEESPKGGMVFNELRGLGEVFDEKLFYFSCRGFHLLRWFENNLYCNRCGTLAENKKDEIAKICPKCGYINYPRISPAIIVAIINKDKILLAHNSRFADKRYSVIAGFVEPGETFEECVKREVREEVGIEVRNIKYFSSQPWPFPDSLMVAFTAEYAGGEINEDKVEILHADWYGALELPKVPSGSSVAGKLIKWFVENNS